MPTPLTILRFVDDFLFLTSHLKLYQSLAEILSRRNSYHLLFRITTTSSRSLASESPSVRWCGLVISPHSINIDSSKSRIHFQQRSSLRISERGSFQSILITVRFLLQSRIYVLRHVGFFPSLLQDLYFYMVLSLRRVLNKRRVRQVSKARLLMIWMIRYLKRYTMNRSRSTNRRTSVLQWLVMAAFLKVMRTQSHLRQVGFRFDFNVVYTVYLFYYEEESTV